MNGQIEAVVVEIRQVYGATLYYAANAQATRLAMLAKTKTLTLTDLRIAARMGFEIRENFGRPIVGLVD
jgi:hypothetical protein